MGLAMTAVVEPHQSLNRALTEPSQSLNRAFIHAGASAVGLAMTAVLEKALTCPDVAQTFPSALEALARATGLKALYRLY